MLFQVSKAPVLLADLMITKSTPSIEDPEVGMDVAQISFLMLRPRSVVADAHPAPPVPTIFWDFTRSCAAR